VHPGGEAHLIIALALHKLQVFNLGKRFFACTTMSIHSHTVNMAPIRPPLFCSAEPMVDTNLAVSAVGEGQDEQKLSAALQRMAGPLSRNPQGSQFALVDGFPYQLVQVPMKAPMQVGWIVIGFPINQKLVDDMRALSDMTTFPSIQHMRGGMTRSVASPRPSTRGASILATNRRRFGSSRIGID